MHNRRKFITFTVVGSGAALMSRSIAAAQDSTPESEVAPKNKIFTNVVPDLPRAEDGKIASVGFFTSPEDGTTFALIHNATEDDFIMRQGWGKALDGTGEELAEVEKVELAPYSWEADSYGLHLARFDQPFEGVESLEFEFPTVPLEEATGDLENISVTAFDPEKIPLTATVTNDTELSLSFAPIIGIFFDEEMNIVGGASNLAIAVGPGQDGEAILVAHGEVTNRYLLAAFGSV